MTTRAARPLAILAGIVALGLVATALGNYVLNPLIYSPSAQQEAAAVLNAGRSFAIPDSNIDWRAFRRAHVRSMTRTPDVVIFGGSRWQEASGDVAPGRTVYNAFVSNDHFEDMMSITEVLHSAGRLPKLLVLSLRFSTFEFLERRDADWWKSFGPEYRTMPKRLGVPAHAWIDTLPRNKWIQLLSLDAFLAKAKQYRDVGARWVATDALSDPVLDVVGPDGALRFSERHLRLLSPDAARKDAVERAAVHRTTRLKIDERLMAAVPPLLSFLEEKGVRVVFAQTPFHPAYLLGIKGSPYHEDLERIEAELTRAAAAAGVPMVGSFDAIREGCSENDYRDFNHARVQCLRKIVARIPAL